MESTTGVLTRDISVSHIGGQREARIVPAGTTVTVHEDEGGMYVSGEAVQASVYVEKAAVKIATPFEAAKDARLREDIVSFTESADESYRKAQAAFAERLAKNGAFDAIRWKGEDLIATQLGADLAKLVADQIEKGATPSHAVEVGQRYLQSQIVEGVTSSWSGLMTNEAMKARGKAAYDMQQHGGWSSLLSGGNHGAMFAVVRAEIRSLNLAQNALREAYNKQARARTEAGREKVQAEIEIAQTTLDQAKAEFAQAAFAAGCPADLIDSYK
jgi:hypothetical protein